MNSEILNRLKLLRKADRFTLREKLVMSWELLWCLYWNWRYYNSRSVAEERGNTQKYLEHWIKYKLIYYSPKSFKSERIL